MKSMTKTYFFISFVTLMMRTVACDQPDTATNFRIHYESCVNKNSVGGCQSCISLYQQKLDKFFNGLDITKYQCSCPDEPRRTSCSSKSSSKANHCWQHSLYKVAQNPHVRTVEDQCPIMYLSHLLVMHDSDKKNIKRCAATGDLCALYVLGLWHAKRYEKAADSYPQLAIRARNRAILIWNMVGKKDPKIFCQIGDRLYWWNHMKTSDEEIEYYLHAGRNGDCHGYFWAAEKLQKFLDRKMENRELIQADEVLRIMDFYRKGLDVKSTHILETTVKFVVCYEKFLPQSFYRQVHEQAITACRQPRMAYSYAQWLQNKSFDEASIRYFTHAAQLFAEQEADSIDAQKAWKHAACLYFKMGDLTKAEELFRTKSGSYTYARFLQARKRFKEAFEQYDLCINQMQMKLSNMFEGGMPTWMIFDNRAPYEKQIEKALNRIMGLLKPEEADRYCKMFFAKKTKNAGQTDRALSALIKLYKQNPSLCENSICRKLLSYMIPFGFGYYARALVYEDMGWVDFATESYKDTYRWEEVRKDSVLEGLVRLHGLEKAQEIIKGLNAEKH